MFWLAADLAAAVPSGGGLPSLSPPCPAFSLLPCPLSPRPRSQSALPLRGRGRPRLFHARGFAPCIPGLNPSGTGSRGEPLTRRGRARLVGGWVCRRCTQWGGLPSLSPPCPAFSLLPCPLSPRPRSQSALPLRGRGRPRLFHARGFAPCIPGLNPGGTGEGGKPRARRGDLFSASPVRREADRIAFP